MQQLHNMQPTSSQKPLWVPISLVLCIGILIIAFIYLGAYFYDQSNKVSNSALKQPEVASNQTENNQETAPTIVDNQPDNTEQIASPQEPEVSAVEVIDDIEEVEEVEETIIATITPEEEQIAPSTDNTQEEITAEEQIQETSETIRQSTILAPEPLEEISIEESDLQNLEKSIDPKIVAIANKLKLTTEGKQILYSTKPELVNKDTIDEECSADTSHPESYIAGCYHTYPSKIYIWENNVNIEGILMHELMHAVWQQYRLDNRFDLHAILESIYDENQNVLSSLLEPYETLEDFTDLHRYNELHSFIATEIEDVPEILQQHYDSITYNRDIFFSTSSHSMDHLVNSECILDFEGDIVCTQSYTYIKCGDAIVHNAASYLCIAIDQSSSNQLLNSLNCNPIDNDHLLFACTSKNGVVRNCTVHIYDSPQVRIDCVNSVNVLDQITCTTEKTPEQSILCNSLSNANTLLQCTENSLPKQMTCESVSDTDLTYLFVAIIAWKVINASNEV